MSEVFASVEDVVAALRPAAPVHCLRPHVIEANARHFTSLFPGDVLYAVKCNDDARVLRALHAGGIRHFDTASLAEVATVAASCPDAVCHYMHPVKSREAVATAYAEFGVRCFALDHPDELRKILEATGHAEDLTLVVRLEVPPTRSICDLSGKFGVDEEGAAALLRAIRASGNRCGLTFHVGSLCLDPDGFRLAIAAAGRAFDLSGVALRLLDVGGGFPAAYVGVEPPSLTDYIAAIETAAEKLGWPATFALQSEPGRALVVGGASVVVRVELRRDDALYLNDGVFGSLSELKFDGLILPMRVVRPGRGVEAATAPFRLFGPTCDSSDAMPGPFWLPADVRQGDWIEIGQLGAYGQVLRTRFNGFYPEATVIARDAPLLPTAAMRPTAVAQRSAA